MPHVGNGVCHGQYRVRCLTPLRSLTTIDGMKTIGATTLVLLAGLGAACSDGGQAPGSRAPAFSESGAEPGSAQTSTPTSESAMPGTVAPGAGGSGSEAPSSALPLGGAGAQVSSPGAALQAALPRSTPEAEGLDSERLLALVAALDGSVGEIHSMMLLRHGKVVAEGWWAPYVPEDIHVLYSVTKSFNATAVGFAVDEGLLSIDDLVLPIFPELQPAAPDPLMQGMRVVDLLTMSTGHTTDSIDAMRQRTDGQWTRSFLESAVPREPGTYFMYNSGAAYMLGAIVQKVTGMSVEDYLTPRLFEPLGITEPLWGKSEEGVNLADGGLSVRTEDLAKFGQLYLQNGMWNGQQLLPADWASAATSSQVSTGNSDGNWSYGYGYQFWRSQVGYRADGSLGQFSFVLPEQDIVLAVTSGTTQTDGVMNAVWQNLLPAIVETSLPENPSAQAALTTRLAALSTPTPTPSAEPPVVDVSGRRYAIEPNSQGILSVQLDLATEAPSLLIEDADGAHTITLGTGQWARGRTGFKKRINELFDTPEQGIAALGTWTAADTFTAKLAFNETPYIMTASFKFDAERVLVDMSYNVRWGAIAEPQLVGTR
jgi:CubicO group peptidase (beta-lactamase class C family)